MMSSIPTGDGMDRRTRLVVYSVVLVVGVLSGFVVLYDDGMSA